MPSRFSLIMAGDSNTANAELLMGVVRGLQAEAKGRSLAVVGSQSAGWTWDGKRTKNVATCCGHEGYPGRGIAYLGARLRTVVPKLRPSAVVLNIGPNDLWNSLANRTPINAAQSKAVAQSWVALAKWIAAQGCAVVPVLPCTPKNCPKPLAVLRAAIAAYVDQVMCSAVDLAGCGNDGVHFLTGPKGYGEAARRYVRGVVASEPWVKSA